MPDYFIGLSHCRPESAPRKTVHLVLLAGEFSVLTRGYLSESYLRRTLIGRRPAGGGRRCDRPVALGQRRESPLPSRGGECGAETELSQYNSVCPDWQSRTVTRTVSVTSLRGFRVPSSESSLSLRLRLSEAARSPSKFGSSTVTRVSPAAYSSLRKDMTDPSDPTDGARRSLISPTVGSY